MGIGAGLGTLLAAGVGAASAAHTQSANASAQQSINKKTMEFNSAEALKAREFEHQEAEINRLFNQRSANSAMAFSSNEAAIQRAWEENQAAITRSFNSSEAGKERKWSSGEAAAARQFNAQEALLARQFEERMANSAHQREIKDLYKAGLNPILSVTGGSGAATPVAPVIGSPMPSGAAASSSAGHGSKGEGISASGTSAKAIAASVGGLNAYMKKDVLGTFINTAMDGMRLNNDIKRANAADLQAKADWLNAKTNKYGQEWRHWVENEKLNISRAEANARIDKLNNDIKIAYEDLDIRKDLRDATVEERKALVSKLMADVDVSKSQAALLGLQEEELSRKMRYGSVLMTYLPADIRDKVAAHMIDFVAENGDLLNDFLNKQKGDIFEKASPDDVPRWVTSISDWLHKKGIW